MLDAVIDQIGIPEPWDLDGFTGAGEGSAGPAPVADLEAEVAQLPAVARAYGRQVKS